VKKLVLLTNDDGITAPGIQALKNGALKIWDTITVAPDREQSAASHALTLNRPLRINRLDKQTISVDGTPTDCVMLSLNGLLEKRPEIVISGLNYGANLGDDVIYSGTVAAAAEAAVLGVPSIAVSVVEPDKTDLSWCADIACKVTEALIKYGLPKGVFLNVNIPPVWNGGKFEIANLGTRLYRDIIVKKTDPRGKPYYWIGGQVNDWSGDNDCDFAAVSRGNISVTPLQLNMTATYMVDEIRSWTF
jgi:5'-nucleotidase